LSETVVVLMFEFDFFRYGQMGTRAFQVAEGFGWR